MILCNENKVHTEGIRMQVAFEFSLITATLKHAGFTEEQLRRALENGLSNEFAKKVGLINMEVKS